MDPLAHSPVVYSVQLNAFSAIHGLHAQLVTILGADTAEIKTEQEFYEFVKNMAVVTANFEGLSRFAERISAVFGTIHVHNAALPYEQRFHLDWWSMVFRKALPLLAIMVVSGMKSRIGISPSLTWAMERCLASVPVYNARNAAMDALAARINASMQ